MNFYAILADVIAAVHVLYVAYVVLGLAVILLGVAFRWGWVRNFWFRITHLLAIAIVVFETFFSIECPLFTWEEQLRVRAGQTLNPDQEDFVRYWANQLIASKQWEQWQFDLVHLCIGGLIILVFILAPPRMPRMLGGRIIK